MAPSCPGDYRIYGWGSDIEFFSKCEHASTLSWDKQATYFLNFSNGQFAKTMRLSSIIWGMTATFYPSIALIYRIISKKQMVWADTLRGIARMKNLFTGWNVSKVEHPRNAMTLFNRFWVGAECAIGIPSMPIESANPKPTSRSLINMLPKSLFNWSVSQHTYRIP